VGMKKTKLQIEYDYDFELLGISSSAKFYKLAWAINNRLDIRLIKLEDFLLEVENDQNCSFINYSFEEDSCYFHLFKNKSPDNESGYLVPEMTHFDYILKFNGTFQSFAVEEVLKELREVKYIEYIALIPLKKLKSKDNFLN
jgi:hypothetical protein